MHEVELVNACPATSMSVSRRDAALIFKAFRFN